MMLRNTVSATSTILTGLKTHIGHTTENLRGISTPSSSIAWISGDKGTIMRTIDNGKTWETKQIPDTETLFFRDIKAFDANTAYVMSSGHGEASRIYYTCDGGHKWQLQLKGSHPAEFFNCMAFWNHHRGMVLSDPVDNKFKIFSTEDGNTWLPLPQDDMPLALENEGAFAASGSCMTVQQDLDAWFCTGNKAARVFHTNDAGMSWQVVNTPLMKDTESSGIFSIAFYDLHHGVIAGGDYKQPEKSGANLAITDDGGKTWQLATISPQYYWSAVSFTPDDHEHLMVVGPEQAGYTQSKSPQNWDASMKVNLNAFSFWSKDKVLAVGPNGMIMEIEIPIRNSIY